MRANLEYESFRWGDLHRELDWLPGGRLNIAHEAVDRHADGPRRDKPALIWDGENGEREEYTFGVLKTLTNSFANVLKSLGIGRGDRVCLYLDRLPELYVAFLGILKIGAIVVPLPSHIEPDLLRKKLSHGAVKVVVTQPELRRRMAAIIYELFDLQHILVVNKNERDPAPIDTADLSYDEEMAKAPADFDVVPVNQYDHSVMHYVGDADDRPRGVVYSHEAAAQHHAMGRWVLDLRDDDVYWYASDLATVQGTASGILAPWAVGATVFAVEGKVDPEECYTKIQSRRVTVLCAGTAEAEQLAQGGNDLPGHFDLSSLRHLVSVGGPPLSAESVRWSERALGKPFHDCWCGPETGDIVLATLPGMDVRPGSSGRPLPGVEVAVLDGEYAPVPTGIEGALALRPGWPSMFRACWNDSELYNASFRKGWYIPGQQARIDNDGYVWLTASDVL